MYNTHAAAALAYKNSPPFISEGVCLSITLEVYKEGFLSTLGCLPPSPGDVPLLALDSAVEHFVLLVQDASGFKRVVQDSITTCRSFPSTFHDARDLS